MSTLSRPLLAVIMFVFATSYAQAHQVGIWQLQGWKTDFENAKVNFHEIRSGGPPKDGIPPLDEPIFSSVSEVKNLTPQDPVIGLEINGDARAYPLRVLIWHEIANDVVGGKPVAVTYCPLCNAAIVFDATIDGERHTFGTTGKLRKSDLIMYDRKTESWWQQFTGSSIVGEYAGKELKFVPARLESYGEFSQRHPDGKVLIPNNPGFRNYGRNPYVGYDDSSKPFLYSGAMPQGIEPMARVVVVRREGAEPLVVAMQKVRENGELSLEGHKFSWRKGQASAVNAGDISKGKDVGTVLVNQADNGKPVAYDVTFAFVAHAFHPNAPIIK